MIPALDTKDGDAAKAIAKTCFESGLLVGPCGVGGQVIKLIPPLTIPDDDLEEGLQLLERAVATVMEGRA